MISKELKSEALGELLNARMHHTNWVSEVLHGVSPKGAEEHTQCEFGKWMLKVEELLGGLNEFKELDMPHRELHSAYRLFKNNPDHELPKEEITLLSKKLINRIDLLELRLNQPV